MDASCAALPDDIETLKNLVLEQARQATELAARNQELESQRAALRQSNATINAELERYRAALQAEKEKYQALQHLIFGRKSEKTREPENPKQSMLFNEAETYSDTPDRKAPVPVAAHERKKSGRKPFPATMERNEIIHALSDDERACPACGNPRPEIGEARTEELRLIPARAVVDVHVMKKYGPCACATCTGTADHPVIQAAGPAKIVPGSRFSNGTIAFFLTSKFVDAQPFYRMEGILARWGVETGRSTLCSLAMSAGRAVGDLVQAIRDDLRSSPVIGMDETTVQVLHETNRQASSKSYMWVAHGYRNGKRLLFFHYHPSRAGEVARAFLKDYQGYLQTDGYAGYARVGDSPGIVHVGCMAHVRRKFHEADRITPNSGGAAEMLAMIGALYHEEDQLRSRFASGEVDESKFLSERRSLQTPKLVLMREWLVGKQAQVAPASLLGKAISYALGQWALVMKYLDHPLLTPDNNAVENAIRPFVVGRKNWLFSNTPSGAHTSAGLYSLIETAKANGHEPYKYLCFLFDRLPTIKSPEERLTLLPYRLDPKSY